MNYSSKFRQSQNRSNKQLASLDKEVRIESDRNRQFAKSTYQNNNEYLVMPSTTIKYFQNENFNVEAYETYLSSKRKKQSTSNDRLSKINGLLSNIMSKHEQMKTKLRRLKNQKQNQEQQEIQNISFTPKLTNNPRYHISSTMQERNRSWDEARVKHYTSIREEIVEKQCKECTFTPRMIAKPKSNQILKNKIENQRFKQKEKNKQNQNMKVTYKFEKVINKNDNIGQKKEMIYHNYSAIKNMIKFEMSRIKLDE